jgi:L-threonylcarbamoyladenylate synthase
MNTLTNIKVPTPEALAAAGGVIRSGRLVAFPTETVYGLGGDATNDKAVAAIYAAKGRPQFNPLIVHISHKGEALPLVVWNDLAEKLAATFWPGPLTLVLPRAVDSPIALLASAGLDTIAIRCPAHPVAQELIRAAGRPIAAPSANASGKLSPTQAGHVLESLGSNVDLILDGGACRVGVESTVVDLTGGQPTILRHGGVTKEQLEVIVGTVREALHDETAPKSPGMTLSHYAPDLPIRLNAVQAADDEAFLVLGDETAYLGGALRMNLSPSGDLLEAAAHLFAMLRQLDQAHLNGIAVAPIPMEGIGVAMNDRLARAATPRQS